MEIKLVVAVTDMDWFGMLREKQRSKGYLEEVNFWRPSKRNFKALEPGEIFLFKPKGLAENKIAGGGIFERSFPIPCSLAWEAFGEANGVASATDLTSKILAHRRTGNKPEFHNPTIGCRILKYPIFLEESDWFDLRGWANSIQSNKTYETSTKYGRALWQEFLMRLKRHPKFELAQQDDMSDARYSKPQLFYPRLGQNSFRVAVAGAYKNRCAITQERTLPALEAAHIRPYAEGGEHHEKNGLLLRSDIHNLFDKGYVTVTEKYCFEVSPRIKEEFENGREYYGHHGQKIAIPTDKCYRPSRDSLRWHNEECFR